MIKVLQRSTERPGLGPSIEEIITDIIKDKENLEQVRSEPSGTSSESLPFNLIPKIDAAYHYYFRSLLSRVRACDEQWLRKIISNYTANYEKSLDSILRILQQEIEGETLLPYLTLDLWTLEQLYILRRHSEVTEFLADNSFLLPVLQDAYEQIKNYFGKSTQIALEVVTDPEVAGEQELAIFIRTNLSPNKAFKKLKEFDKGWWLDTPFNVREKLCIDVEFE